MATYSDDFDTLDLDVWLKQDVTGASDISIAQSTLLSSAVDGGRIRRPLTEYSISSYTEADPLVIGVSTDTGLTSGQQVWCLFESTQDDAASGIVLDGVKRLTATSGTTFTVQDATGADFDATGASYAVTGTATVSIPSDFSGTNVQEQRIGGLVHATAEADGNRAVLWARHGRTEPALAGYGVALTWGASGARTLSLLKLNEASGAEETLTSVSVTHLMETVADSDLNQGQFLSLAVSDRHTGEDIAGAEFEAGAVYLRAWLNSEDEGETALEWEDRDRVIHRDPGGFAVEVGGTPGGGAVPVYIDQWMGETVYVVPETGTSISENRTLSEIRADLDLRMSKGTSSTENSSYSNAVLNDCLFEIIAELGDNALFLQKIRRMTLSIDADDLVTMPGDVERIDAIFDAASNEPTSFKLVGYDDQGRLRIYMDSRPSGRSYDVRYWHKVEPMVSDSDICPIPRRWDNVLVAAARLRIQGEDERDKAHSETLYSRYRTLFEALMRDMNRQRRMEGRRMRVTHRATVGSRRRTRYAPDWQTRWPR